MVETLEIEWKVAGLLPIPIASNCIYYNQHEDETYAKRVFGCPHLNLPTSSIEPTKQFHQALNAELKRNFNLNINRLPYVIPIGKLGKQAVKLKLRLFESQFLVLSIQLQLTASNLSVSDTIKLLKFSSHSILESIARFCFNVHHCPEPSQMGVKGWQCKPLIKMALPLIEWVTFTGLLPQDRGPVLQGESKWHSQSALYCENRDCVF